MSKRYGITPINYITLFAVHVKMYSEWPIPLLVNVKNVPLLIVLNVPMKLENVQSVQLHII